MRNTQLNKEIAGSRAPVVPEIQICTLFKDPIQSIGQSNAMKKVGGTLCLQPKNTETGANAKYRLRK